MPPSRAGSIRYQKRPFETLTGTSGVKCGNECQNGINTINGSGMPHPTGGWERIETLAYTSPGSLRAAEVNAIRRLDQLGARSTPRMQALFRTVDMDGRTEMFDPSASTATCPNWLAKHAGNGWAPSPKPHQCGSPSLGSTPPTRRTNTLDRNQGKAAAKAVATRKANAVKDTPDI